MAVNGFPVTGLHLLLFLHATHSFVLLTANIEDVKKLAMKFVSESLAEKIAGFIAQAAQHMISHVSEEVHRDVSEENKEYNIKEESSEREYDNERVRSKAKKSLKQDYKKDELFNDLEGSSKNPGGKKHPIEYAYTPDQDGNEFQSRARERGEKDDEYEFKFKTDAGEVLKKGLEDRKENKEKDNSSGESIEDNTIADGRNENSEPMISFRAEDTEPVKRQHVQLLATSGDLKLTRITTERSEDDKNGNGGSGNENGNKEVKKEETWF